MPTMAEMKKNFDDKGIKYPSGLDKASLRTFHDETFSNDRDYTPLEKRVPVARVYDDKQDHIFIEVRITTLDGKSSAKAVKIVNPTGCIIRSQVNNADGVFQTLFSGLVQKYGAGHIK